MKLQDLLNCIKEKSENGTIDYNTEILITENLMIIGEGLEPQQDEISPILDVWLEYRVFINSVMDIWLFEVHDDRLLLKAEKDLVEWTYKFFDQVDIAESHDLRDAILESIDIEINPKSIVIFNEEVLKDSLSEFTLDLEGIPLNVEVRKG